MSPLYQRIATTLGALQNCMDNDNSEWVVRHSATLTELENLLPSGSGIDGGCEIEADQKSIRDKMFRIKLDYHAMNDVGFYVGWIPFIVNVKPDWDGVDVQAFCNSNPDDLSPDQWAWIEDNSDIEDYISDVLYQALL